VVGDRLGDWNADRSIPPQRCARLRCDSQMLLPPSWEPHEAFHQLGRLPVLGRLEVRVGPERGPSAVTVPGPTRDGAHVDAG
jgi:hypothetical protein